jgi:hypothetical protein
MKTLAEAEARLEFICNRTRSIFNELRERSTEPEVVISLSNELEQLVLEGGALHLSLTAAYEASEQLFNEKFHGPH